MVCILVIRYSSMGGYPVNGSKNLSLHEVELSGNNIRQQIAINFYPDSPLLYFNGFSASGQFKAAELIRNMITNPQRRQLDQTQLMLLHISDDVHPNPCHATKYPCCCCMPFSTILVVNPGFPGLESSVLVSS